MRVVARAGDLGQRRRALRWPVKILVPLGFALVALQGVSEIIKRAAALRG